MERNEEKKEEEEKDKMKKEKTKKKYGLGIKDRYEKGDE